MVLPYQYFQAKHVTAIGISNVLHCLELNTNKAMVLNMPFSLILVVKFMLSRKQLL